MDDPRVGTELAGYRIEAVLGRGGMGVVYLAEQVFPKRKIALKVIAPELAKDERFRDRFVRESNIAASLDHPNIVPIHAAGEADGILYIAMRYVEGTDLKETIAREGPLDLERAANVVTQTAAALDAAHRRALVHRDVKAANVLLVRAEDGAREHVYLSDFGLTKRTTSDSGITGTGQFVGTLDYAAPEQFQGKPLDARTDVYSLGCVLYECLTGEVPFRKESDAALIYAHLQEPPPRPSDRRSGLPKDVDAVATRSMAKEPDHRYSSCGELAEALRSVAFPAPSAAAPPRGPRRALLAALAAAAALAIAVIVVLVTRSGGRQVPPPASPRGSAAMPVVDAPTVDRIDPTTESVVGSIPLAEVVGDLGAVAAGEDGIWITSVRSAFTGIGGALTHLDPRSGEVEATIRSVQPVDVAVGEHTPVWVANSVGPHFRTLASIDPATDSPIRFVPLTRRPGIGSPSVSLTIEGGSLWVADSSAGTILRLDARSGKRIAAIRLANATGSPEGVAAGEGAVWVLDELDELLAKVDRATNRIVDRISVAGTSPVAVAAGEGWVWVASETGTLTVIDPVKGEVKTTFPVAGRLASVAVGNGSAWAVGNPAEENDGTAFRIDPTTFDVTARIPVGGVPQSVAIDETGVWVTVRPASE